MLIFQEGERMKSLKRVGKKVMAAVMAAAIFAGSGMTAEAIPARMPDGVLFDSDYYVESNMDLMPVYGRDTWLLYQHYVLFGKAEGRAPLSTEYVYPELPAPASKKGYTINELLMIYCTIIEANGITWDPSLKGNWDETVGAHNIYEWYNYMDGYTGTSWGTGFLEPYNIEQNAYSEVAALRMGDTAGNSDTRYYFEVLGWDESMGMIEIVAWSA